MEGQIDESFGRKMWPKSHHRVSFARRLDSYRDFLDLEILDGTNRVTYTLLLFTTSMYK